jgi:hypothetical protein
VQLDVLIDRNRYETHPSAPFTRVALPVRKLVRPEPVACDFCQRILAEAIPTFFYAQAPDRTPKHPKGAYPMSSLQQFLREQNPRVRVFSGQ